MRGDVSTSTIARLEQGASHGCSNAGFGTATESFKAGCATAVFHFRAWPAIRPRRHGERRYRPGYPGIRGTVSLCAWLLRDHASAAGVRKDAAGRLTGWLIERMAPPQQ